MERGLEFKYFNWIIGHISAITDHQRVEGDFHKQVEEKVRPEFLVIFQFCRKNDKRVII